MKKLALAALLACGRSDQESTGVTRASFESAEAVLVDVELDGHLHTATNDAAAVKNLISTQLLYTVGSLNADRSVGTYSALSVSNIVVVATGASDFDVSYHAKFPVAWGGGTAPNSYEFVLPRAVAQADQIAFSRRYAATCADPEGGITKDEDASRLWLFLRPRQSGCTFDANDVARISAKVSPTPDSGGDKYPEYRRIWSDQLLHAVYVFSYEEEDAPTDAGRAAYDHFIQRAESLLGATATKDARRAHLETYDPDGRGVQIDVALVGTYLPSEPADFDAWFDSRTPKADLVMYSGHAGLGSNVRALSRKGSFEAGQYVIWAMNGCDTFAYADHTLADRRAILNPDDPTGTKYMDTVSNALGAWFHAGDDTAITFLNDLMAGGAAPPVQKSYRQIFQAIDPSQVVVVTGEEDNEAPAAPAPSSGPPSQESSSSSAGSSTLSIPVPAPPSNEPSSRNTASCTAAPPMTALSRGSFWPAIFLVGLGLVALRRRD